MTTTELRDEQTIAGFGEEWRRFDQSGLPADEQRRLFDAYFALFPWDKLPPQAEGADIGCGSGRWAQLAAPRLGTLHCVDPSDAIDVAKDRLGQMPNVRFHRAGVEALPFAPGSLDCAWSLGVLHHVPDTAAALRACAVSLRPGAPLLVYLYYALDNRPAWFRALWRTSEAIRAVVSRLPMPLRHGAAEVLATLVYWPLSRSARLGERLGLEVNNWPLAPYRHLSRYTLRTDALDRFGTRLEQRFTRSQVIAMMEQAGLERVQVAEGEPYWCAIGYRGDA